MSFGSYIFMRYPGGKAKALTFSYDDGTIYDKKLAEIFDKYNMKATFNFTNDPAFSKEEIHEYFLSKGHEIAVHCANHRASGNTRAIEGITQVLNNRLFLEEQCDGIVRGMAYPDSGITALNNFVTYEDIKRYLIDLDIAYARTLGSDNNSFAIPEDFHAWMPTAHHNNSNIKEYIDEFISLDISTKVYHASRRSRLFYIWGHSYEFYRDNNWELIESICEKFSKQDDIWFATNIEIYDYIQAYKSLRYSADGRKVQNPTLEKIWLDVAGTVYSVAPGETITLDI